jgi:RNA polymerase sigma-70 factor (ECF subfamily)
MTTATGTPSPTATDQLPDGELMARMASGDREALAVIVDRYKNDLVNYLARLCGRETGEELAQDTFLRLFAAAPRYRDEGRFQAFLYRIATNLARSLERRQRRHRLFTSAFGGGGGDTSLPWPFRSVEPSHENRLLQLETGRALERELRALPLTFRVPLVLFAIEGWPQRAIADFLGCAEATVKTRIHRGRERLRERLLPYRGELRQAEKVGAL